LKEKQDAAAAAKKVNQVLIDAEKKEDEAEDDLAEKKAKYDAEVKAEALAKKRAGVTA